MPPDANTAVQAVYSSDWSRIVATLIRSFGDFDVAEEAAQEAFAAAVDQWRDSGIPDSPPAWIIQTAGTRLLTAFGGARCSRRKLNLMPPPD